MKYMDAILKVPDKEQKKAAREYQKKLFGYLDIIGAPAEFYELQVMFELHISPREWEVMTLSEQGKCIAFYQLRNMAQLIEHHELYQEQDKAEVFAK